MMNPTLRAALWMIGAIGAFTTMAIGARALADVLDTFELMFYRSVLGIFIVLGVAWAAGTLPTIRARHLRLHFIRNLVHFIGQNLWFFAIMTVPLAQVFALEFTTPVWVLLLSPLILGERLTRMGMIAALIGFLGILIVARPDPANLSPGLIAAAACAIFFALSAILTRKLTRSESVTSILFILTASQSLFGLIAAGYDGHITLPGLAFWPWLVIISIAGLVAHFCLTQALAIAPASTVMPMDFARLPAIAVVGMLLYDEPLELLVFVGAALIFLGNYINIRQAQRQV
jgi:drug/metabolite transporter (DMT)-like permease